MSAKKSSGKSSAPGRPFTKGDPRRVQARGPKKGAPNAGRPPSEVKAALVAGFAEALPELLRIARKGKTESDRVRAIDVLGKYAGLQSIELEIARPVALVIEGLE